jgi:hypothetical protein
MHRAGPAVGISSRRSFGGTESTRIQFTSSVVQSPAVPPDTSQGKISRETRASQTQWSQGRLPRSGGSASPGEHQNPEVRAGEPISSSPISGNARLPIRNAQYDASHHVKVKETFSARIVCNALKRFPGSWLMHIRPRWLKISVLLVC